MRANAEEPAVPLAPELCGTGPSPASGESPFFLLHERHAVRAGGREVRVTPTQFRLLAVLLTEPGRPFGRAELIELTFPGRVAERTVDVHIKDLRRRLGPFGARIETVRGGGYCYQPDPPPGHKGTAMTEKLPAPKRVLFVCVENANRSQMAEAFAHLHGGGRVEAYSAGSRPSGRVNPRAIAAMRELGYDLTRHSSKAVAEFRRVDFDVVVGMGCGDEACPLVPAKRREEWGIPDPKEMPPERFREVRDLIECKVKELLATL
jgi:protein-tyrosine-phosphatase